MKGIRLPGAHYAAGWKTAVRPVVEVNELGLRYAQDSDLLLELCQCFHPYLMKYLVMICRGHVPIVGVGKNPLRINADAEQFIRYFLPKGQEWNASNRSKVVRHFHLAFKEWIPKSCAS